MRISDWSSDVCSSDLMLGATDDFSDPAGSQPQFLHLGQIAMHFPCKMHEHIIVPAPEPAHLSLYAVDLQGQRRDAIAPRRWKGDDLAVGHDSTPPVSTNAAPIMTPLPAVNDGEGADDAVRCFTKIGSASFRGKSVA